MIYGAAWVFIGVGFLLALVSTDTGFAVARVILKGLFWGLAPVWVPLYVVTLGIWWLERGIEKMWEKAGSYHGWILGPFREGKR